MTQEILFLEKDSARTLLINRKIDWNALQQIIFLKASENNRIPYLKTFYFIYV